MIAGVDEVGRGPLAGPVVAATVVLDPDSPISGLKDSKKLSPKKREILAEKILQSAYSYSLGRAEPEEIDEINILQASLLAMKRSLDNLDCVPDLIMVDGIHAPDTSIAVETVIGGDDKIQEISAASILAKVTRDRELIQLDKEYPEYGFARHKGYPTKLHIQALEKYGPLEFHRKSYAPVARLATNKRSG